MRMTFRMMTLMLAVSGALLMGCGDDSSDDSTAAPTPDAGTADVAATDTAATDTAATDTAATDTASADTGPTAPDFAAVSAALEASCGGCHGGAAGCSIATACFLDDEANLTKAPGNAGACGDATSVAECSIARIDAGTMPPSGVAPADEDLAVLEAYVAGM